MVGAVRPEKGEKLMRVLRTILGMLLLTVGLPSLLGGAALWAAMQHRDQGGAFSGELQRLATPGYAYVVPDVDRLLRTDAPFTRIGDTQLRINAATEDGPAFIGLAPSATVEKYLRGDPHLVFFPAVAIALALIGFTFLGDGLRDALDPRLKGKQ